MMTHEMDSDYSITKRYFGLIKIPIQSRKSFFIKRNKRFHTAYAYFSAVIFQMQEQN